MDLLIRNKWISLRGGSVVKDLNEQDVYKVQGKFFTFTRKKFIQTLDGQTKYVVRNKFWRLFTYRAFVYDEKDNFYRLSPAFDVTRTDYKAEHEMTVNGNGKPTVEDLVALAETFSLSKKRYKEILDKVISVCQE